MIPTVRHPEKDHPAVYFAALKNRQIHQFLQDGSVLTLERSTKLKRMGDMLEEAVG